MFCPICGFRNVDEAIFCESCGKNLEKETKYGKNRKTLSYILIIPFVLIFGGVFLRIWQMIVMGGVAIPIFFIIILLLPRLSGPHAKRYCPRCEETEFNENFCVSCRYNLDDVLGYYKTDDHDIEMNKNFIKIYKKTPYTQHDSGPTRKGWHSHHREEPEIFTLDKISNLRFSQCKKFLSEQPCMVFEYDGEECNFHFSSIEEGKCVVKVNITSYIRSELATLLSDEIYAQII